MALVHTPETSVGETVVVYDLINVSHIVIFLDCDSQNPLASSLRVIVQTLKWINDLIQCETASHFSLP